jgi:hypothetical protein
MQTSGHFAGIHRPEEKREGYSGRKVIMVFFATF